MKQNQFHRYFYFVLLFLAANILNAQPIDGWDEEKIRGERYHVKEYYRGSQYFLKGWSDGKIFFSSGDQLDNIKLRYNAYTNELITYNTANAAMTVVDKASVLGFQLQNEGKQYYFKKYLFDGLLLRGEHFSEVLFDGEIDFIALRRVQLLAASPYYDGYGKLKNMEFLDEFRYFLVNADQHFENIYIKRKSFLKYFQKAKKREVKRLMRQNRINFRDEYEVARALKIVEENGLKIEF